MKIPFWVGVLLLQLAVLAGSTVAVQLWMGMRFFESWWLGYPLIACLAIVAPILWYFGWPAVKRRLPNAMADFTGAVLWIISLGAVLAFAVNGACVIQASIQLNKPEGGYAMASVVLGGIQMAVFLSIAWSLMRHLSRLRQGGE